MTTTGLDFVPQGITIQVGDSVMWTNLAQNNHNVVSTDCPLAALRIKEGLGIEAIHPINLLNRAYGNAE